MLKCFSKDKWQEEVKEIESFLPLSRFEDYAAILEVLEIEKGLLESIFKEVQANYYGFVGVEVSIQNFTEDFQSLSLSDRFEVEALKQKL